MNLDMLLYICFFFLIHPILFTHSWNWGSFIFLWINCALIFSYHGKRIFYWSQRIVLLQDFPCSALLPHLLRREEKQRIGSPPSKFPSFLPAPLPPRHTHRHVGTDLSSEEYNKKTWIRTFSLPHLNFWTQL